MPPAIEVTNLTKHYGANQAVRGISLTVETGEIFGLLGPNGAGKTSTIEILEGYRPRSGGEVRVLGIDPGSPTRAWREQVGLVLQECELEPNLTVRETINLYASFYPKPRAIDEVIALVGLGDKEGERVGRLSGGQRRRADVAVALIGDPDLIFLDEPTTGFDPSARRDAWAMIAGLRSLGKTVLLTTHYMDEAEFLADRVAIMRAGQIVATGKPGELGAASDGLTYVTFRIAAGTDVAALAAAIEFAPTIADGKVTIESRDAQRTLHRLTAWADGANVRLDNIEAHRPSLEDVFLELTHKGGAQ